MDRTNAFSLVFEHHIFDDHHRAMQPGAIVDTILRYINLLEKDMYGRLGSLDQVNGEQVDLIDWVFAILVCDSPTIMVGKV